MIEAGTVEQSSRQAEAEQQNREATGQTGCMGIWGILWWSFSGNWEEKDNCLMATYALSLLIPQISAC
jgi:hypothetical protein